MQTSSHFSYLQDIVDSKKRSAIVDIDVTLILGEQEGIVGHDPLIADVRIDHSAVRPTTPDDTHDAVVTAAVHPPPYAFVQM